MRDATADVTSRSQMLADGVRELGRQVLAHAPVVLSALAVLVGLWLVALLLRAVIKRILGASRLDGFVQDTRVGAILKALDEDLTASLAVAKVVYLAILLMALTTAADMLGLSAVGRILSAVLGYVPTLVSAIVIVAAGGHFASLVSNTIRGVLREMKSPYARPLASVAEGALLVIVFTIAIGTLGVDLSFVTSNLTLLVGAATLTLCFLFAWSMRRPAEEIIANYYLRRMASVGDRVVLGNVEGTVEAHAPLGLMLRDDGGEVRFVPARHVLDGMRRKRSEDSPKA